MSVLLEQLGSKDREMLYSMLRGSCVDGECYAFAIALSRGTGWPMIGLMENNVVRHAAVRDSNGGLRDVRGVINEEEFGAPYNISPPYNLKPIVEKDLLAIRPVSEIEIDFVLKLIQAIWPDLPWKSDCLKTRVVSFVEELGELSRKHNLWIYGPIPTSLPTIAEGQGDETGYKLKPTMDGLSYTINRIIGAEFREMVKK